MCLVKCNPRIYMISIVAIYQLILIILISVFATYDTKHLYPQLASPFQSIHIMVFFGFGYLMSFLKRYGYSSVGFSFLLGSLCMQWGLFCVGTDNMENGKMPISFLSLILAEVATATVLVSTGAVLGRTSYFQLIVMSFFEVPVFCAVVKLGKTYLKISDSGFGNSLHTFGAFFGLGVSFALSRIRKCQDNYQSVETGELDATSYRSEMFSLIGTLFLWLYFPSFNGAYLPGTQNQRAIINTVLSLAASCVTSFIVSALVTSRQKFSMTHIQRSTLAGGVAVAGSCNLVINPHGALVIGTGAGLLAVIALKYITPALITWGVKDTCGILSLHGMVGVFGGLINVGCVLMARPENYGPEFALIYPAMLPVGDNRSITSQAVYQLAHLGASIVIAIASGLIVGCILSCNVLYGGLEDEYSDELSWIISVPSGADPRKKMKRMTSTI